MSNDQAVSDSSPISRDSTWSVRDGPTLTVKCFWIDADGRAQVLLEQHDGQMLSMAPDDMRRRAATGEIQRIN